MEMNKEDAIEYLQDKGKIKDDETKHPKFSKDEQNKIKEVMKQGKIYGDPIVEING